jgi:hypothetical protein
MGKTVLKTFSSRNKDEASSILASMKNKNKIFHNLTTGSAWLCSLYRQDILAGQE